METHLPLLVCLNLSYFTVCRPNRNVTSGISDTLPRSILKQVSWDTISLQHIATITAMVGTHVLGTVSEKRPLNAKVDLPFDGYYAYFCTYAA